MSDIDEDPYRPSYGWVAYWLLVGLLVIGSLVSCSTEPSKDNPLTPLSDYPNWYAEVEACSGVSGDYSALRFYLLDQGDIHAGITYGHTIFLRYRDSFSRVIVEHEMLHSLIDDGNHTSPKWWACGLHPQQILAILE